jgi:flagellar P-ring protein FlgI
MTRDEAMRSCQVIIVAIACLGVASAARGDHRIGDICRIKGQEENVLHGMGFVIGLKGTGDGDLKATQRGLAHYMEMLGHRVSTGPGGQPLAEELKSVKNVALVYVMATVPAGGAQQGDVLDCTVSAVGAKSIDGGYLMLTELQGPVAGNRTVFALAKGNVALDDPAKPQVGRVPLGCQVERKIENQFVKDGKLLLVMNKDHAAFQTVTDIERAINQEPDFINTFESQDGRSQDNTLQDSTQELARAIDPVTIEVTIPNNYAEKPTLFASTLLSIRLSPPQVDTRVIINERKQIFIIGADVEIGPVAVMHKNRLIQVGDQTINEAVAFDPRGDTSRPKLESLVAALNVLKVPTTDVIDIIKMLKHKRALFGELIIE